MRVKAVVDLENLISDCNQSNFLQLYVNQSTPNTCWMRSKSQPDLNIRVHLKNNGFVVEYFCSTIDYVSCSAIQESDLREGLRMLLEEKVNPEESEELRLILDM